MSMKIILHFESFEICEQEICTKMSNLNNGVPALDPRGFGRLYTLGGGEKQKSYRGWAQGTCVQATVVVLRRPEEPRERGARDLPFSGSGSDTALLHQRTSLPGLPSLASSSLRTSRDGTLTESSLDASFTPPAPTSSETSKDPLCVEAGLTRKRLPSPITENVRRKYTCDTFNPALIRPKCNFRFFT